MQGTSDFWIRRESDMDFRIFVDPTFYAFEVSVGQLSGEHQWMIKSETTMSVLAKATVHA